MKQLLLDRDAPASQNASEHYGCLSTLRQKLEKKVGATVREEMSKRMKDEVLNKSLINTLKLRKHGIKI